MKFVVILSVVVACVVADVSHLDATAPIVRLDSEINPDGSWRWASETGNGIYAKQEGHLKNVNEIPSIEVEGAYRYNSPDGPIELTYIANEYGFQPKGAHLPVAPAIPAAIARSIEYIRTHASRQQ